MNRFNCKNSCHVVFDWEYFTSFQNTHDCARQENSSVEHLNTINLFNSIAVRKMNPNLLSKTSCVWMLFQ